MPVNDTKVELWANGPRGFKDKANRQLSTIEQAIENAPVPPQQVPGDVRQNAILCEITALANDYLTVRRVASDGVATGEAFDVAKPETLRHDASLYEGITTLTTVDTNTAEATDGSTSETIYVTLPYVVRNRIKVSPVPYTGVNGSDGTDLRFVAEAGGRAWAWDGD